MKKPIRMEVVMSTTHRGLLSLREVGQPDSPSATWLRRQLMLEGYAPGDLVDVVPVEPEPA